MSEFEKAFDIANVAFFSEFGKVILLNGVKTEGIYDESVSEFDVMSGKTKTVTFLNARPRKGDIVMINEKRFTVERAYFEDQNWIAQI